MKILKIFNNNSVVALSNDRQDVILTGPGVGFQKKVGEYVDESKIERIYVFQDEHKSRFEKTINDIPALYFEITESIIQRARKVLKTDFSSEIFLAITDHISFALKRKKKGVSLSNVLINETKVLYKEEYKIGLWAIEQIAKKTGVILEKDEAGYIALHLVNFSLSNKENSAAKILTFTNDILSIIQTVMKTELKEDSLEFSRISIHLKYLGERIFREVEASMTDTTYEIREHLKSGLRLAMCINRITKLIEKKYNYILSPDEETYLCIHIKRNIQTNE